MNKQELKEFIVMYNRSRSNNDDYIKNIPLDIVDMVCDNGYVTNLENIIDKLCVNWLGDLYNDVMWFCHSWMPGNDINTYVIDDIDDFIAYLVETKQVTE